MKEQRKVNHTTLSTTEVEMYMNIKKRIGRLPLEEELKIIHSYGFDVEVLCLGAYLVKNWEDIVVNVPEMQRMFSTCMMLLPSDCGLFDSRVYGIITRFDNGEAYTCGEEIGRAHV